jgi:hypothetical protein
MEEGREGRTGVFVALEHALHGTSRVPELDAAILGARDDPLRVVRDGDAEHVVLRHII